MEIETTSQEKMENSLANLMNISGSKLYQYIKEASDSATENPSFFNTELLNQSMEQFYSDELPDEIYFFHLSRRLIGSENEICYNLHELLTSSNTFSRRCMCSATRM